MDVCPVAVRQKLREDVTAEAATQLTGAGSSPTSEDVGPEDLDPFVSKALPRYN